MDRINLVCGVFVAVVCCASCQPSMAQSLLPDQKTPERTKDLSPEVKIAISNLDIKEVSKIDGAQPGLIDRLEAELRGIGAHLEKDGKVYDRAGKEIYFFPPDRGWGTPPPPQIWKEIGEQRRKLLEGLNEKFTVIMLPLVGPPNP